MLDLGHADLVTGGTGTRRLLSVSGGGLLGVIPAAMLVRYEALGVAAHGPAYRLCDSFDAVGGASTGAVIATGVALGLSAADIAGFYLRDVPRGFRKRRFALPGIHDRFDGDLMERFFSSRTGTRVLDRTSLHCDLSIMVKDAGRGRPLMFTTDTTAKGHSLGAEMRHDRIALSRLLRASTAAPGLFTPVRLTLDGVGEISAIDGGISPFNDPGLLLARAAWQGGEGRVDLTALGTGSTRPRVADGKSGKGLSVLRAVRALMSVIKDNEVLGRDTLETIADLPNSPLTYRRHDLALSSESLTELGVSTSRRELGQIRDFCDKAGKERLFEAALTHAERTIHKALPLRRATLSTGFDRVASHCPNTPALA